MQFFFYKDGTGNIVDDQSQQATAFIKEMSFCLKSLTDLRKCIKNKELESKMKPVKTNSILLTRSLKTWTILPRLLHPKAQEISKVTPEVQERTVDVRRNEMTDNRFLKYARN